MYKNIMQVQPTINEEGFYNLAEAIILQSVKDYRYALRTLKKYPYSLESNKVKSNVERFFCSKWYSELTNIDGKILIKKLREEVK